MHKTPTQLSLFEEEKPEPRVRIPPPVNSILAVKMPCGKESLARVRYPTYPDGWCGYGLSQACGLRIEWLPATDQYVRGYQMNWGHELKNLTEGSLPWPPDPSHTAYGSVQLGEYRVVSLPQEA